MNNNLKDNISNKALFHPCGDCCYYGNCHKNYHDCEYSYASVYTDDEILLYQKYLDTWYNTHDEGEPVCFEEWFNNEFQEGE